MSISIFCFILPAKTPSPPLLPAAKAPLRHHRNRRGAYLQCCVRKEDSCHATAIAFGHFTAFDVYIVFLFICVYIYIIIICVCVRLFIHSFIQLFNIHIFNYLFIYWFCVGKYGKRARVLYSMAFLCLSAKWKCQIAPIRLQMLIWDLPVTYFTKSKAILLTTKNSLWTSRCKKLSR